MSETRVCLNFWDRQNDKRIAIYHWPMAPRVGDHILINGKWWLIVLVGWQDLPINREIHAAVQCDPTDMKVE